MVVHNFLLLFSLPKVMNITVHIIFMRYYMIGRKDFLNIYEKGLHYMDGKLWYFPARYFSSFNFIEK